MDRSHDCMPRYAKAFLDHSIPEDDLILLVEMQLAVKLVSIFLPGQHIQSAMLIGNGIYIKQLAQSADK